MSFQYVTDFSEGLKIDMRVHSRCLDLPVRPWLHYSSSRCMMHKHAH
jgi:hypothetical protein